MLRSGLMADDISKLLARLHSEMVSGFAGVRQEVSDLRDEMNSRFRESFSHSDAIYARFDRLETEYQALSAAISRLETRSLSRAEFEREVEQLRGRIDHLQHRLGELEKMHKEN